MVYVLKALETKPSTDLRRIIWNQKAVIKVHTCVSLSMKFLRNEKIIEMKSKLLTISD